MIPVTQQIQETQMNKPTPCDRLLRLAEWYQAKGLTPEETVTLTATSYSTDSQLYFAALLRLWPGRVWEHDSDLHICFMDEGVRVACVLDHRERREHQHSLREIEGSVYSENRLVEVSDAR